MPFFYGDTIIIKALLGFTKDYYSFTYLKNKITGGIKDSEIEQESGEYSKENEEDYYEDEPLDQILLCKITKSQNQQKYSTKFYRFPKELEISTYPQTDTLQLELQKVFEFYTQYNAIPMSSSCDINEANYEKCVLISKEIRNIFFKVMVNLISGLSESVEMNERNWQEQFLNKKKNSEKEFCKVLSNTQCIIYFIQKAFVDKPTSMPRYHKIMQSKPLFQ